MHDLNILKVLNTKESLRIGSSADIGLVTDFTVTISIGRNQHTDGKALADNAWIVFRTKVGAVLEEYGTIYGAGYGSGNWNGDEDTLIFIAGITGTYALDQVKETLKGIGRQFNQEAIGFMVTPAIQSLIYC